MEETLELNIVQFQTAYNWVNTELVPDMAENELAVSSGFDYETLSNGKKRFYIDIGIKTAALSVDYRSGFEFDGEGLSWSMMLSPGFVKLLVGLATKNSHKAFLESASKCNIAYPHNFEIDEENVDRITNLIVDQYANYRKENDKLNAKAMSDYFLEWESGTEVALVFDCMYIILDAVLFVEPAFSRDHNIDVITDYIFISRYNTIKHRCMTEKAEVVELTVFDSILFLECLNCSLQLLVGRRSDMFEALLERKGFEKEDIRRFITLGTEVFAECNDMLARAGARLIPLENQPLWDDIIW